MFAGCTKWPSQKQTAKDQIFLFLILTMPWTSDADVDHPMCISMFCTSNIYIWDVWFSRDEEIEIPNVANSRVAKSCPTQDPHHTLVTVTVCVSTPVRRKQSVGTTCGCLRILMNKIELQKRTHHLDLGETKKLAGIHKVIEKPHPIRSIELRSNPVWTWTH